MQNELDLPVAKDEFVSAYLRGNSLWPQRNFGLRILTSAAVLSSPTEEWLPFLKSRLSPDQLHMVGTRMTGKHRVHKVKHAFLGLEQPGEKTVSEERLEAFWRGNQNYVGDLLRGFNANWRMGSIPAVNQVSEILLRSLISFYQDPANIDYLELLKDSVSSTQDVILSPGGLALSPLHHQYLEAVENKRYNKDEFCFKMSNPNTVEDIKSFVQKYIKPRKSMGWVDLGKFIPSTLMQSALNRTIERNKKKLAKKNPQLTGMSPFEV